MGTWAVSYRVLGWLLAGAALALIARLALVVAATPTDLWLSEFEPTTASDHQPATTGWAVRAADWINDPAIARALIGNCIDQSTVPDAVFRERCGAAMDYALAIQPTSSELWLAKARLLSNQGILGEEFADALRNSYATGAREGWIAAERLPFALRRRQFLPDDFVNAIGDDVALVLANRSLAGPLVESYIADPFLREETWDIIEQFATLDQQEDLVSWLQQAVDAR